MLLLALPLRPGAPLSPPLSALLAPAILAEYGLDSSSSSSAAVLHRDLATLDHLRDAAVSLADPGLPAAAEPLSAYLAQLAPLTTRFFALDASSSRVPFSWRPALTATATAKRKPLVLADVAYERASLLFNLAAVYSTVAAASFTSSESVADLSDAASAAAKTACEFSRRAAGVIATLRSDLKASGIPHTSLPLDLQPATLTLLFHLHRAQAGECVWRTAAGAMSNGILTKIAASIADEYAAAVDAVKGTQIAESDLLKHWVNHLTAKHLLFAAHAAHRRASVDAERGLHGDCVARLRLALSLLQQRAAPILKYVNGAVVAQLRALEGVVAPAFTQALKDNDLVYVQPEPSPADLVQGPGIKPDKYGAGEMEFVLLPPATVLFAELLPLDAHRIATDYANRRDEAADALAHAATRSVANASAALRDSGVPGLLAAAQDAAAPPTNRAATPGSIVAGSPRAVAQDRAREFTVTMGGASAFELQIVNLGDLAARCGAMMDEILTVLDAEAADDLAKLQQFGGRWDRTPSTVLQRSMRDRIVELRRKANVARQSDGFIRDRYMRELEKLRLLESVHTTGIDPHLPPVPVAAAPSMAMHAAIDAARGAVDSIKGDIAQAEALSARARQVASTDSLTRPLGELLAREGNMINAPVLVAEGLAKYDTMRQQLEEISANLPRRKDTLERARVGLLSFVPSANSASPNVGGGDRTARILNDIESAFLAAQEISGNLREGRKFYDDLDRVLNELFRQATDFAAARALESKDLLAEITAAIASGTPPPLPARPGQFMPGVWDQDQPPRFSRPGGGR